MRVVYPEFGGFVASGKVPMPVALVGCASTKETPWKHP